MLILSNIQKQIVAILIPVILVGGGVGTYWWSNQANLPLNAPDPTPQTNAVIEKGKKAVKALEGSIIKQNPDKLLFADITPEQLDVYSKAWVNLNFNSDQRENALISGAEADPDGDGIPNKMEFLYASNPMSKYTYCGEVKPDCQKTDKQMIDSGVSPLTNLPLELPKTFRMKKVDQKIVQNTKDNISIAAASGLDFPKLYEQSRLLNLDDQFSKIKALSATDNRDNMLKYIQKRLDIMKDIAKMDELTAFTSIYRLLDVPKITQLEDTYKLASKQMNDLAVPESLLDYHKGNLMVIDKTLVIIGDRKESVKNKNNETPEVILKSQQTGKELFWAYRKLANEQAKLQAQLDARK